MNRYGNRRFWLVFTLLTICSFGVLDGANAQSTASIATGQVANSGPSAGQIFDEAKEKVDVFEAAGWPPKGRFTLSPERTETYVEFNKRLWNAERLAGRRPRFYRQ